MTEITYYFDMDGVVAEYDAHGYPPLTVLYKCPGHHYYAKRKPDKKAIAVVKQLYERLIKYKSYNDAPVGYALRILSTLTMQGNIYLEQAGDKKEWIRKYLPFMYDIDDRLSVHFAGSKKRYIGEALSEKNKLQRTDILIDDYNKNLEAWEENGGTAVKYCNGLNSPDSWEGFCITPKMTDDEIVEFLLEIADSYNITKP